ncbi:MAG: TIGR01212 family radical SAM protein [Bacteriovoracaceae bacterium]|nr:TIGR01212 family radical SAM protein [Bacteriovoracaceae bacterium]
MNIPYNHYNQYLKEKFGERVQKITVLGGFTCPNRDGKVATGGCTYCNNLTFSAPGHLDDKSITYQIDHGIRTSKRRYKKVSKYIIYFQSYSNTYAPLSKLKELYSEALQHPEVIGLSIGTRPDCVSDEILDYLEELNAEYDITMEYGLESVSDHTLEMINRGHNFECFKQTAIKTGERNIPICAHVIFGFHWESLNSVIEAAVEINKLPIKFLKVHQLHVVKDTAMGDQYKESPFKTLSKDEYMEWLRVFLEHLNADIVIQRLYGEAPEDLLLSPHWGIQLPEFTNEFIKYMEKKGSYQGKALGHTAP